MRWKTKPIPKQGDTRWVKRFAWFPTKVDSGVMLWLESYYVRVKARRMRTWSDEWSDKIAWEIVQTVTPEEYRAIQEAANQPSDIRSE